MNGDIKEVLNTQRLHYGNTNSSQQETLTRPMNIVSILKASPGTWWLLKGGTPLRALSTPQPQRWASSMERGQRKMEEGEVRSKQRGHSRAMTRPELILDKTSRPMLMRMVIKEQALASRK